MPTQTQTDERQTAREAALELGRELSDECGPLTKYYDVHEDQMLEGHVSLRVSLGLVGGRMLTSLADRDYDLEYIGEDDDRNGRAVFAIRTQGDVHEGVY